MSSITTISERQSYGLSGEELILVPTPEGYQLYPLLLLMGFHSRQLRASSGFGAAPVHFITQRGPFQQGQSVLGMRYDPRISQIIIAQDFFNQLSFDRWRADLLEYLRPSRAFGVSTTVSPHIYRRYHEGGEIFRGSDLEVTNGEPEVFSATGRFIDRGGLVGGERVTIGGVLYRVSSVPNDYTLVLTTNYAGITATGVAYEFRGDRTVRDLYFLLEEGPSFDNSGGYRKGYLEALRLISHDPFWHGQTQYQTWTLPESVGDLVFDGEGAYFGTGGTGRWAFISSEINQIIDVYYWGSERARPTIVIVGPALNPEIENITTGRTISTEVYVAPGETLTINTANLISRKDTGDSVPVIGDMATFGLEPDVPNRLNQVRVTFDSAVPETSIATLYWDNLYVGD